jgi:peptidoglycan hydrolase CwlO-like protein
MDKVQADVKKIKEKLQQTYAEKSEINRKLQQTYAEKAERGLKIKELERQIKHLKENKK